MDPTSELFFGTGATAPAPTMAELFGSSSDDDDDAAVAATPMPKKKVPIVKPIRKHRWVRSSARSIVNQMRKPRRKVMRNLAKFANRVDTEWLANNRLKHRVKPVVFNYTHAKKILQGRKEIDRNQLLMHMNALLEHTVQLFRTQDDLRDQLASMSKEVSHMKRDMGEFVSSVLISAKAVLVDVPPFLPNSDDVMATSFFQLRACNRPTDPRKLFSRRSQAAAKSMSKEAAASIPDAAVPSSVASVNIKTQPV